MTVSTLRGMLVRTGDREFILPTRNVARVARIASHEVRSLGTSMMVSLQGQDMALLPLADALGLPRLARPGGQGMQGSGQADGFMLVLVMSSADHSVAFQIDELIDEQEIIQKNLGPLLKRVRNISGTAFLEDGRIVPILNTSELMQSAVRIEASRGTAPLKPLEQGSGQPEGKVRNILVADDSITARSLLRTMLQTAGYQVATAVDGVEAYSRALAEDFDLLVSDVDMPRMSGFELCAKVRGDPRLAGIPVILVTALESRDDIERGIEVGADAYIVKSSFDQSNLLETIGRLL